MQQAAEMEDVGVMSRDGVEEERAIDAMAVENRKEAKQSIESGEKLLPGIPNEITISLIAPKLPWTTFHILSSVSLAWQRAVRSHEVHNARVCAKSTQTLVAMDQRPFWREFCFDMFRIIALYSVKDGSLLSLPPIPGVLGGIPCACACTSLDGKLYVLGGSKGERPSTLAAGAVYVYPARSDVYVLDIAGQRQWKQCASMEVARKQCGCGVKDGKIYVFGGTNETELVLGSEVYDPKADAWSPIAPMPCFRYQQKVTTVGEELFMHSGELFDSDLVEWKRERVNAVEPLFDHIHAAVAAEVYHPQRNEWRIVEHFTGGRFDVVVLVQGKLYRLNQDGIQAYDLHKNSWGPLQPISFDVPEPGHFSIDQVLAAEGVDDEVLAIVRWITTDDEDEDDDGITEGYCLIRSQGLGGKSTEMVWQKLQCSISLGDQLNPFMCPIEL